MRNGAVAAAIAIALLQVPGVAHARWYDPSTGSLLSNDPVFGKIEDPMTLHPYVYAKGNPLRYTDPTGEMPPGALTEMAVRRNMTPEQVEAQNEADRRIAPYALAAGGMVIAPEAVIIGAGADAWLQVAGMADDDANDRPVRDTNYASMSMSGGLAGVGGPVLGAMSAPVRGGLAVAATAYAGVEAKEKWDTGERWTAVATAGLGLVTLTAAASDVAALNEKLFRGDMSIPSSAGALPGGGVAPIPTAAPEPIAPKQMQMAASNQGVAPQHGSKVHNDNIERVAARMKKLGYREIRKNQQQQDAPGTTVGTNRPDVSGINPKTGQRINIEYDTVPAASRGHQKVVPNNDPNSVDTFVVIDPQTGKPLPGSVTVR